MKFDTFTKINLLLEKYRFSFLKLRIKEYYFIDIFCDRFNQIFTNTINSGGWVVGGFDHTDIWTNEQTKKSFKTWKAVFQDKDSPPLFDYYCCIFLHLGSWQAISIYLACKLASCSLTSYTRIDKSLTHISLNIFILTYILNKRKVYLYIYNLVLYSAEERAMILMTWKLSSYNCLILVAKLIATII